MQLHNLAFIYMSLHAVPWACMQFFDLACSYISLLALPFFVWAAHKNFEVLVDFQLQKQQCKTHLWICLIFKGLDGLFISVLRYLISKFFGVLNGFIYWNQTKNEDGKVNLILNRFSWFFSGKLSPQQLGHFRVNMKLKWLLFLAR